MKETKEPVKGKVKAKAEAVKEKVKAKAEAVKEKVKAKAEAIKEKVKAKARAAKEKVKAKARAVKEKVKAKARAVKGKASVAAVAVAAVLGMTILFGCSSAQPASRTTSAHYEFEFAFDDSARNTLNIKLNDGAVASADSSGSTETQTATPTTTIDIKPDIRYNDAIAGATSASKGVLSAIGYGADAVLEMMAGKKSGTVKVQKKDGTEATVECENGQCSFIGEADQ